MENDKWSSWLLERRFGNNQALYQSTMSHLHEIRNHIISHAAIREGEVVLDVGSGDGLLAFEAVKHTGSSGRVILSDISQPALDHCREFALAAGLGDRVQFVVDSAEELAQIQDSSVDVVMLRAVLLYCEDKEKCIKQFYRVLRPGGRLCLCEPINKFAADHSKNRKTLLGFDLSPLGALADKVLAQYGNSGNGKAADSPYRNMLNFDERDLLRHVHELDFREVTLEFAASISHSIGRLEWDAFYKLSANPLAPTLEEALQAALTADEMDVFTAYLKPLVESTPGYLDAYQRYRAQAYVFALK